MLDSSISIYKNFQNLPQELQQKLLEFEQIYKSLEYLPKQFVKDTSSFIYKALLVHGDKYEYTNSIYTNKHNSIKIICRKHGEFLQTSRNHCNGRNCQKCSVEKQILQQTKTLEEFIEKANKIHNNFYDYSNFVYINSKTKGIIICPIHGKFIQTPSIHLRGSGCPECGKQKTIKSNRERNRIDWSDRYSEGILYLIECWNDVERFVKIGVTSRSVEERYRYYMPYNYSILKEYFLDSKTVSKTEKEILKLFKHVKPSIHFDGASECLQLSEKDFIIEHLENILKL